MFPGTASFSMSSERNWWGGLMIGLMRGLGVDEKVDVELIRRRIVGSG